MSNFTKVAHLLPVLRIKVRPKHRKLSQPEGTYGRLKLLRNTVTDLIRDERIEVLYPRGDEARGYVERLISEAIKYGDCHKHTMEMANFWLNEKQLVHKLFKVLVPRYRDTKSAFTAIYHLPLQYGVNAGSHKKVQPMAVLELKGNPFPTLAGISQRTINRHSLHNVLLEEARKYYRLKKINQLADEMPLATSVEDTEETTEQLVTSINENTSDSSDEVKT